jgi:hypothetical protein
MTGPSLRIGQYWNSPVVPDYVAELIATFRDRNPSFEHTLFDEAETERFIAEHFTPRELSAFRACAIPSMQSDYFRYCFVLAMGGVYADADFRCVRSLNPLVENLDKGKIFLSPTAHTVKGRDARRIWSGFFAFREPGHPLLELALEIATANVEARIPERVWSVGENVVEGIWLTVGPGVLSLMRLIRDWGSFDAFLDATAGTAAEPFGELYCETIGEYARIVDAFDGVEISPFESMLTWIERVTDPLAYKQTDVHWHNVKTAIFR